MWSSSAIEIIILALQSTTQRKRVQNYGAVWIQAISSTCNNCVSLLYSSMYMLTTDYDDDLVMNIAKRSGWGYITNLRFSFTYKLFCR